MLHQSICVSRRCSKARKGQNAVKRHGHLFERITDIDNLKEAHRNARKGKTKYREVQFVDENEETCLHQIQQMLLTETYQVSEYEVFARKENGKERILSKLPYYPDRIIQWAILLVIGPLFEKKLITDTYSSIKGRGMHLAVQRVQAYLKKQTRTQYCLKMDVRKYYQSIDKAILKQMLGKMFKDQRLLHLLAQIVDSYEAGIPIGNYLSQYLANIYLDGLDRRIKEVHKIKGYYRYMDDLVIIHKNKKFLHHISKDVIWYCEKYLNLSIKKNYQVFPVEKRWIDFVGYVIRKNGIRLRKGIKSRMRLKLKKKQYGCIPSYNGWLKWCNCNTLKQKYLFEVIT